MKTKLSNHAIDRIQSRFSHLITPQEVEDRVNKFDIRDRRAYIEVKRVPYTEVSDPSVVPDGIARGDQFVAVYEQGEINTVMLRKSWEQSAEYHKIFKKPNRGG
jgi:hypothetical protein